jgi:hypothetical protein
VQAAPASQRPELLGVESNVAEAAKHPYVADFRSQYTFADGAVADA